MSKTAKHTMLVWVVTWPKGTTDEWKKEPQKWRPTDYAPISAEPAEPFKYFNKTEKRKVWGAPVAIFRNKEEALAYEKSQGNCFIIREASLDVF